MCFPMKDLRITRRPSTYVARNLIPVIGGWALLACAKSSTTPPPGSAVNPSTVVIDSSTITMPAPLRIHHPGQVTYDFSLESTIRSTAGDSVPQSDSTRFIGVVRVRFSSIGQPTITRADVEVDSLTRTILSSGLVTQHPFASYSYTIETNVRNGQSRLVRKQQPVDCSLDRQEPLLVGDEVLPILPISNAVADMWADTSRYDLCRGGVALSVTRVIRYHVDSSRPNAGPVVRFIRHTDVVLEGRGSQWGQPVEASGRGSSLDTLTVTTTPPRLHSLTGQSNVSIEFSSERRAQRFHQTSTSRLIAR